jgi:hypothetical protein
MTDREIDKNSEKQFQQGHINIRQEDRQTYRPEFHFFGL